MSKGNKFKSMTRDDVKRITQLKDKYILLSMRKGIGHKRQAREIKNILLKDYDLII